MLSWGPEGVRVGCWLLDTRGDSTAKECRTSRDGAQAMRFPDKSSRPTFKGRRKVSRGVGTRGEGRVGSGISSPLSGWPRRLLCYLERGGAWESLCLLLAKRRVGGAGGRTPRLFLFAFGRRSGCALGSAGPAPGPGDWRRAGGEEAEGRAEPGAHVRAGAGLARPAGRAEQARGPAEQPTLEQPELEEEEEERRRGRRRRRRVAPAGRAWGARRRGPCCWRSCRWVSARGVRRGAGSWGWGRGCSTGPGAPGVPGAAPGRPGSGVRGRRPGGERCAAAGSPVHILLGPRAEYPEPPGLAEPGPHVCRGSGPWPVPRQRSLPVGRREPGSP